MLKPSYFLESLEAPAKVDLHLLCVHGLNQNPQALKLLLEAYRQNGVHCHLLHLPDHWSVDEDRLPGTCEAAAILKAYQDCFSQVREEAELAKVPMGVLGYSYGGLLATTHLNEFRPEKLVLLAPAIQLRGYARGIKLLTSLFSKVKSAPIGGPDVEAHYRYYQRGVPSSVYKSFFEIYDNFKKQSYPDFTNLEVGVFIQPGDELVSYRGLRSWVSKNTSWSFFTLKSKNAKMGRYRHLIFDPNSLGEERFQFLVRESLKILK